MDFFEAQDRARRKTTILVVYLVMALLLMITTLYVVAIVVMTKTGQKPNSQPIAWFQPDMFLIVAGATLLIIVSGSLYKVAELRAGGSSVATMLGGRRINPTTTDPSERQLLNVVEEMAIASGVAVPPVFLMASEKSINAFAAGFTPDDAVIGVSQGTVDYLSRDELQGVIAHEFSHILSGDMRYNLRLIGILHGILLVSIIGYYMLRMGGISGRSSGDRKGGGAQIMLIGLAALVIGSIGLFFGRLIKAAVSRQREYLADASAVQFTRNPDGIAGALKKIGGVSSKSFVQSPEAETASHMFFGSAFKRSAYSPFATHPPLTDRISRIDSSFDGKFPRVVPAKKPRPAKQKAAKAPQAAEFGFGKPFGALRMGGKLPLDPAIVIAAVGAPTTDHMTYSKQLLQTLPQTVSEAAREMFSARALVFALLLDRDKAVRDAQLDLVESCEGRRTREETVRLSGDVIDFNRSARLPLIELVQNTLLDLSPQQYSRFRDSVIKLVEADQRISLFEFVLQRLLLKHLDRAFELAKTPATKYYSILGVFPEAVMLLSVLAHLGHSKGDAAQRAFEESLTLLEFGMKAKQRPKRPSLLEKKDCSLNNVHLALEKLAMTCPPVKKRVLAAASACVAADKKVSVEEAELLRAIANSLDCPIPPIVPGKVKIRENAAAHQS